MGPNDAIDPEFIVNNYLYNDSLLLTDANSERFFTIKMDSTNHFQLNGNGFFPDKIFRSSNLNFCDNLIIGRGFFCVNEKNSDLYIIVHTIEGMNEYYDLKKYKI